MSVIQTCILDAFKKTKEEEALICAKKHLLSHILYEIEDIRRDMKEPCATIANEWLFTVDELFTLFNIHPSKHQEFEKEMEGWKCHAQWIGSQRYFSLFKLIASDYVLTHIVPFTLYYLPSSERTEASYSQGTPE